jgi:SAM-dependent methyltransferase
MVGGPAQMTMNTESKTSDEAHPEWYANESFWEEMFPYMFPAEKFAAAIEESQKIIALSGIPGGTVLDLCCGSGRHAVAFAKSGYQVTGVDHSRFLLGKAEQFAEEENIAIEWVEQDMKTFMRANAYDLALNLFTAFGYFDKKEDDVQVLQNVFASLRPGGRFVLDVMGKELVAARFRASDCDFHADGSFLATKREIFDSWTRIRNEWTLVREDRVTSFKFHHTIYSAQELRDRFEQVGFCGVEIYGDWDGNSYGLQAQRLIIVGKKG